MLTPYGYGDMPKAPDVWFETLNAPSEYADFSYDAAGVLSYGDSIMGLSVVAMPSGTGEVALSRLQLGPNASGLNTLVTFWITGGVPGRTYTYLLLITTTLIRVISILIGQSTNNVLASCPVPPPPSPAFGTPISWGQGTIGSPVAGGGPFASLPTTLPTTPGVLWNDGGFLAISS